MRNKLFAVAAQHFHIHIKSILSNKQMELDFCGLDATEMERVWRSSAGTTGRMTTDFQNISNQNIPKNMPGFFLVTQQLSQRNHRW